MKTSDTEVHAAAESGTDLSILPTHARAARYAALVRDVEGHVRKAADDCLTFDSTPLSFAALKGEQETGR